MGPLPVYKNPTGSIYVCGTVYIYIYIYVCVCVCVAKQQLALGLTSSAVLY